MAMASRSCTRASARFSPVVRVGSRTSPPTQNARSPAPVRTITPTDSSSAAASNAWQSSSTVRRRKAFRRSGRLIVMVARPSPTS
jgi:hypothetical protein